MEFTALQIAPPKDWGRFEDLCLSLFAAVWDDRYAQKNGRGGQPQHGVDVWGHPRGFHRETHGVQCKGKNINYGGSVTPAELKSELAKAEHFQPQLSRWILATTAPDDARLQEQARLISAEREARGRFPVTVLGWESLVALMGRHPQVIREFYPAQSSGTQELLEAVRALPTREEILELATDPNYRRVRKNSRSWKGGRLRLSISQLPAPANQFFGRRRDLKRLDAAWERGEKILPVVAFAGSGKTALILRWLHQLVDAGNTDLASVLGYSFHSQGVRREPVVSAEPFLDAAYRFYRLQQPAGASAWERGEALGRFVAAGRNLLVLDGIEPLLEGPMGAQPGSVTDPGLAAFLRTISIESMALCIITSREPLSGVPSSPHLDLEELTSTAGAQLLRSLGVRGPTSDLRTVSRRLKGHPLSLQLLGSYVAGALGGNLKGAGDPPILEADANQGGFVRKMLGKYVEWLRETPELDVLQVLGLFDRPADASALRMFRSTPAIPRLTDNLARLPDRRWRWALTRLTSLKLISPVEGPEGAVDTHAMVREYFATWLAEFAPGGAAEANSRLFELYRDSAPALPKTVTDMMPLYFAVSHGCRAGRYPEALHLFDARIRQGGSAFSAKSLGAFSLDVAALSAFFVERWDRPVEELDPYWAAELLNFVGFRLRGMGRFEEAIAPMMSALSRHTDLADSNEAGNDASNLSQFYLPLGKLEEAVRFGRLAVRFASQFGNAETWTWRLTDYADAIFHKGEVQRAKRIYERADCSAETKYLYSLWGHRQRDLWLHLGDNKAVEECARWNLQNWSEPRGQLLAIGLDRLDLASALATTNEALAGDVEWVEEMKRAIAALRHSGYRDFLTKGLLRQSRLYMAHGQVEEALTVLSEASAISKAAGLKLYLADCQLLRLRARVIEAQRDGAPLDQSLGRDLGELRSTMFGLGYGLRNEDVEELRQSLTALGVRSGW